MFHFSVILKRNYNFYVKSINNRLSASHYPSNCRSSQNNQRNTTKMTTNQTQHVYGVSSPMPGDAVHHQYGAQYGATVTAHTTVTRRLDSAAPNRGPGGMTTKQQQQHQQQQQQQQTQSMQRKHLTDGNGSPTYTDDTTNATTKTTTSTVTTALQALQEQQTNTLFESEDTLEYFIKFPTPVYRNELETTSTESDFVFVYKETNVPIVLLLGWAGCQDRYLMKYSKIYEDRGLITVRYTAPVDTLFWKRTAMVPIGEKILKLIYDMNFDAHPVIFHIFSNGGAYLYQHISLAIRKHKTPIQIRGMIFDSAPGERRVLGLYRAVSAIYGKERNKKCNCLTAIIITLTLSIMWFVEETFAAFKSLFVKTSAAQTNPFNDLKNEANQFPQLFLYSKGDVVIPYEDVEKFIKIRQQQGVEVSSICFEDAEHVKIFTKYPTQYIHCVCTFINNCLSIPYKALNSYVSTPTTSGSVDSNAVSNNKYD